MGRTKPFDYSQTRREWGVGIRFQIGYEGDLYLDRLVLLRTPWFQVLLHRIYRPDRQRDLHDHPWDFLSLILCGAYVENTPDGLRERWWWNWKRAEDRHSIRAVNRSPVWTLVFCGRKRRTWGL